MDRVFMGQNPTRPTMGGISQNTRPITEAQLSDRSTIFRTEGGQQVMYDGQGNKTWFADTTGGNVTIPLPAPGADNAIGVTFAITRTTGGGNTITITPASGTIDGSVTAALPTQYDYRQYRSNGTAYFRVG